MCTPVKQILKAAAQPLTYKHKRMPLRVQHYLTLYGDYSGSYIHLNSAFYHYEVSVWWWGESSSPSSSSSKLTQLVLTILLLSICCKT